MIEIFLEFDNTEWDRILESLLGLPDEVSPVNYGASEKGINNTNNIKNVSDFSTFSKDNREGYFLGNIDCLYDYKKGESKYSNLYINIPNEKHLFIPEIFQSIKSFNIIFGYAADIEERKHRNRCNKKIGINMIEDWVGRDINKYIPGLYCYTLLSKEIMKKHGVGIGLLVNAAINDNVNFSDKLYFYQFYENTKSWKKYSESLDFMCSNIDGVFSIVSLLSKIEGIDDIFEYDDVIDGYR